MSKDLIEKLREKADSLTTTVGVMNLLHEAADALEAKAAPVGERDDDRAAIHQLAFELGGTEGGEYLLDLDDLNAVIDAAYQRQQAREVVMPDVSAMAKVLSDRSADACNINRDDNWAMYGQEYIDDVEAMLAVNRLNKGAGSHE